MRRVWGLAVVAATVALAVPAAAVAHAVLTGSNPTPGERLDTAPRQIELRFSGPLKVLPDSVQVVSSTGQSFSGPPRFGTSNRRIVADLLALPKGGYTVRWRALSALDGHVVAGVYTFGVRYPAPPATAAYGTTGPGASEQIVRWAYFVAIALLAGGLAFRLVVLRGLEVPPRLQRAVLVSVGSGVIAGIEIGIVGFLLRAYSVLRVPFSNFLYGDLSPLANGTRFGQAFVALTLGFVAVSALLTLAWLTDRTWPLWAALVLTIALSSGLALSGHSSTGSMAWASELADWVHFAAAAVWIGGLLTMAVCLWRIAPQLRRAAFLRFSRLAMGLVGLVVGAGIYLTIRRLPELSDLWEASYGRLLIVKLVLVALALAWGGFHHVVARPVVEGPGRDGFVGRLQRSLLGESVLVVTVLLVAAILVNAEPPVPKNLPAQAAPVPASAPASFKP